MSPNITLYRSNGAASFIPHALLNELNIPYSSVILDFKDGKMQGGDRSLSHEEYKKIHPLGYVPALEVGGDIITELPAVLTYIAELAPERRLFGSTPLQKAKVYEWSIWLSSTLHGSGYGALWRPMRYTDQDSKLIVDAITEKGRKTIMDCYDRIEKQLDNFHAVVGNEFTVVDLELHTFWRWGATRIGIEQEEFERMLPKFTALAERVESRKSVQETLDKEGLPAMLPTDRAECASCARAGQY